MYLLLRKWENCHLRPLKLMPPPPFPPPVFRRTPGRVVAAAGVVLVGTNALAIYMKKRETIADRKATSTGNSVEKIQHVPTGTFLRGHYDAQHAMAMEPPPPLATESLSALLSPQAYSPAIDPLINPVGNAQHMRSTSREPCDAAGEAS